MTSLLLIALWLIPQSNAKKVADTPYRLLRADLPNATDRLKEIGFAVSVGRPLSRADVEKLICAILAKEKPPKFERLNINVFIDMDEYTPSDGAPELEEKNAAHQLAWYVWDRGLPRVRGRLVMTKDVEGNPLEQLQSREFNLEKACPSSR